MEPTYHLPQVVHEKGDLEDFEGPLYLILQLLAKNKIEISELSISDILDQYLEWLAQMKALDLEVASEFVQMASHLLLIKTKMLLTSDPKEVSELDALLESLEQLKAKDALERVRCVLPAMKEQEAKGVLYLTKAQEPLKGAEEYRYHHELWEILTAVRDVSLRSQERETPEEEMIRVRQRIVPKRIVYSVHDKSAEIMEKLKIIRRLPIAELYRASSSRSEVVAVFVSVLELCSYGSLKICPSDEGIELEYVRDLETHIENAAAE